VRVIIAGGRDFIPRIKHSRWLIGKLSELEATEVVSGACSGADLFGESIAKLCFLPITRFPPDWNTHGRSAGPKRNEEMAQYADVLILFPGGRGTSDMKARAVKHGLNIVEWAESRGKAAK
jgi:hypothetical protein